MDRGSSRPHAPDTSRALLGSCFERRRREILGYPTEEQLVSQSADSYCDSFDFLNFPHTVAKCSDNIKKITTSRKANRRPARERKNPSGVQNQLSVRRSNTGSRKRAEKSSINTTLEQPITEATEPATVEAPKNSKTEFTG